MKTLLTIVLLFILIGCKEGAKEKDVAKGEPMPSMEILLTDSTTRLNTNNLVKGRPIALLYFSPDCGHCQEETESILHNIDSLKNVQFCFITIESFQSLKDFSDYYNLSKYPNITIGWDDQYAFLRHFKGAYPPYTVLYDQHRRQKQIFSGAVHASELIATVKQL